MFIVLCRVLEWAGHLTEKPVLMFTECIWESTVIILKKPGGYFRSSRQSRAECQWHLRKKNKKNTTRFWTHKGSMKMNRAEQKIPSKGEGMWQLVNLEQCQVEISSEVHILRLCPSIFNIFDGYFFAMNLKVNWTWFSRRLLSIYSCLGLRSAHRM